MKLLMLEESSGASKDLCRLVIEQAYANLEDLVHFLEADGQELKELTCSNLVKKSFLLISTPTFQQAIASVKIMTRISSFFRELSEDNSSIVQLMHQIPDIVTFIGNFPVMVSSENCEFVANMCIFLFNAAVQKGGAAALMSDRTMFEGIIVTVIKKILSFNQTLP